ncbi:MAG: ABC transporter ATP-binding protein [Planctomycetes bacterium]|nr:ABC transporter ATP-binding protein [Planctomycetota bacterium]
MTASSEQARPIVEAIGLTKDFSDFWMRSKARAVDGIDFEIREREIFGLLGPNGSGKSTTIKMILGLLRRSRGKLSVFGRDPGDVSVKSRIGYLPEESYLYRFLNPRETLEYYAKLFGQRRSMRRERVDELLEMVGLQHVAHRAVGEFSKGMARRLGLAQALINDPEFLILDEPTSGLDPVGTHQVKELLIELGRRGKTILLSSHLLADVEDVCTRMVILYGGRIRAQGTAGDLLSDTEHTVIRLPKLRSATIGHIDELVRREEGVAVESVQPARQRLEEFFMGLVAKAQAEQAATSGALQGGQTARFLGGGAEPAAIAEGRELVEDLKRGEERPASATTAVASAAATAQQDVLAELSGAPTQKPSSASTAPATAAPAQAAPVAPTKDAAASSAGTSTGKVVDRSIIEGLLGDQADRSKGTKD